MTTTLVMSLVAGTVWADEHAVEGITVLEPVARETSASAMAGAGFFAIVNGTDEAISLVGVEADFPRVEIHDTIMDGDVAKMQRVDGLEIAPGETLQLAPGGKHVMFMGLQGDPFEVGETVPATLIFSDETRIDITFEVRTMDEIKGMAHQ